MASNSVINDKISVAEVREYSVLRRINGNVSYCHKCFIETFTVFFNHSFTHGTLRPSKITSISSCINCRAGVGLEETEG